jgi:hypothetical protein|tara:strand:- start:8802 stop:9413 length:612 start_codon:yes stop_codon:yes gene_type:complete
MYATIKDVEPVPQGAGQWVRTRNDLERLVETPLLAACGQLYDKNVPTNASTANANNVALGQANISIDYDALSSENREIADKNFRVISHDDGIRSVQIDIPIEGPDVSVDVLSRRASAAAEKFRYQPMDWAPRYTFDELVEEWGIDPEGLTPESFVDLGYFFDVGKGVFYLSDEHFRKANPRVRVLPRVKLVDEEPKSRVRLIE